MEDSALHLPLLSKFALAFGLAILLPKLMERVGLPPVLGFLAVGALLGPALAGVLDPNAAGVVMLAEIGKLLFMFFVGFEIDLKKFNETRARSLSFGLLTFLLPLALGAALARFLGNGWNTSLLVGSLIASHTLLAFPILQRLGLAQHPVVAMVVGGTIFTDIASMLVLAITVSVHVTGFSWAFLGRELLELAIYVPLVILGAGALARKAIIRFGEKPEARVMILLVVIAACGELAHVIQLEGIVGAFLAGIAVKRAVRGKFAIESLEVTAQAIFIPAFFISTGFLMDLPRLAHTIAANPVLVVGIIIALVVGKFLAAWLSVRLAKGTFTESGLAWSVSLPQMAATLASAVVAYQTVNSTGTRLLAQNYVDAILVLVVLTCVAGPILSERFALRLKNLIFTQVPRHTPTSPGAPW
jgi:Kef-type K+ transport system membrane component KefB